ncbi:MAG: 1-acyl-sn-glycerol-3-phosphate acyltransferase [Cryomorphaceae bacterium]|nr:1-acyl-sn-glycerol-3-phosphate acyltransferase [Cryomorphaceae bacterium]
MKIRTRDAFGNNLIIKRIIIFYFGLITWYRFNWVNSTTIVGSDKLKNLPKNKVLFVSNHQTYFADVACFYHVFGCVKWGVYNRINYIWFLLNPPLNIFFIAAQETMKSGLLPKLFSYVGSVSIKRSWREAGKEINRGVDPRDIRKIEKALDSGWVITFPQGTTRPYAMGRRGTAQLIRNNNPIVIPVVVDGFRRAFDRKGLLVKKRGVKLSMTFKDPLEYSKDDKPDEILRKIMEAIEQEPEKKNLIDAENTKSN